MNFNDKQKLLEHIREVKKILVKYDTKKANQILELAKHIEDEQTQMSLFGESGNEYYIEKANRNKHHKSRV